MNVPNRDDIDISNDRISEEEYDRKKTSLISRVVRAPIQLKYAAGENSVVATSSTVDSPNSGYVLTKAKPKVLGVDGNTAINHELAHILFNSFDPVAEELIKDWAIIMKQKFPKMTTMYSVALRTYHEAMNVVEDQRIESLWAKIYLGNAKDFVRVRKKLGKRLEFVDHPSMALLAERFFREDLVKKTKYSPLAPLIHDVEGTSIHGTIAVLVKMKPYLDEFLEDKAKQVIEHLENPKDCPKFEERKGDNQIVAQNRQQTYQGKEPKPHYTPDEKQEALDKGIELQKEFESRDYKEVLEELSEEADEQVGYIKENLFDTSNENFSKRYKEVPLDKQSNAATSIEIDSNAVKEVTRLLNMFKDRNKERTAEAGNDIDVGEYIAGKTQGTFGDCFIDDSKSKGLSIVLSIDGSGSMRVQNSLVAKMVATLWKSTEGIPEVDIKCITWSSDSKGDMRLRRYESFDDLKYLPLQRGGFTPTHFGLDAGVRELKTMKGRRKLLIVVTDGIPYYKVNGTAVRRDMVYKQVIKAHKRALKQCPNITIVGVGHGTPDSYFTQMFKTYVRCNRFSEVSSFIMGKLKREIIHSLK
tara:strand:- start:8330 stop:10084 length:1755 start_codon:yes stop_codon:yes gene_type:complete